MRVPRLRVFDVSVNGTKCWREEAHSRSLIEFQHHLATEDYPGKFVRVIEKYIGGAKPKRKDEEETEVEE